MNRDQIKQEIEKLIKKYADFEKTRSRKEMDSVSEANVRADFIDPLFEILGWDILNPDEYDREHFIRGTGFADVALKQEGAPVVFIEAKRFGGIPHIRERGDGDWTMEERQAILYAARSNCKWAILTNFEKFRVFNAATGLTILNFEIIYDYSDRLSELLYLTKDSVQSGRIEKLAEREEKPDIDLEFLELLNRWRVTLANDIYTNNFLNEGKSITIDQIIPPKDLAIHPARDSERMVEWIEKRRKKLEDEVNFAILKDAAGDFDVQKLKNAVQRILDRLIIVRWAEDNLITDDPNILSQKLRDWKTTPAYNSIVDLLFADRALFDKFNDIHNGRIFERGHICEKVKISDEVLGGVIEEMSKRSFRKFDFDILGNTYETYLGHTLYRKEDGTLGLKPSQETRKESGIYYTPPYVVDYIVKNTLGAMLAGKTPEEVSKIRVLDPACGSGSFLIKTFDYFSDYYKEENERIRAEKERRVKEYLKSNGNQLSLDFGSGVTDEHRDVEYDILVNNIHGVDLDEQACEIAAVNLMLKGLQAGGRMPLVLGETIKTGNSLISGGEAELSEYFGDGWEDKKPFNWEDEFGAEGFDVVVGNPPYINVTNLIGDEREFLMKNYSSAAKRLDIYVAFIERGINLLKNGGQLSFIIPYPFLNQNYAEKLRKMLLDSCVVEEIVDLSMFKVFPDAVVRNVILILKKEYEEEIRNRNKIKITIQQKDPNQEGEVRGSTFYTPQEVFYHTPEYMFRLELNEKTIPIIKKVNSNGMHLGKILVASWGARGVPVSQFHLDQRINDLCRKMVKGGNIGRYSLNYGGKWILYDISKLYRPSFPELFESEKLVISKVTGKTGLIATYDGEKHYTDDSLCCCILKHNLKDVDAKILRKHKLYVDEEEVELSRGYDLKYVLGLINSKLLNFYFKTLLGYALNVYPESIEQLPIAPATPEQQKPLIELADRMLDLHKQLREINTDFDRYINLYPRIKDTPLKECIDVLPITDKEVLKDYHQKKPANKTEGKIKEFEIAEKGEWLAFRVGYLFKSSKGKETLIRIDVFKCRIDDLELRKFLYYSIREYTRPGMFSKGNIYERLLAIRVPRFYADTAENAQAIYEIMTGYLAAVGAAEQVEREIAETDQEIDARVYELYGLGGDEIKVVEKNY